MHAKYIIGFIVLSIFALFAIFSPIHAQEFGLKRVYVKSKNDKGLAYFSRFIHQSFDDDVFSIELPVQAIDALKHNPNIEFRGEVSLWQVTNDSASPQLRQISARSKPSAVCAPANPTPWGVSKVHGGSGGGGIKVAVVDTGVTTSHPDLKANIIDCKDLQTSRIRSQCTDGLGHGTHVAGTIAAKGAIVGVAPDAKIMALKVCSDGGWCYGDDVARGIRYAADHGANIINISLGGSTLSTDEKNAIDYATNKGVLIVAAAGNSGPGPNTINYPAAYNRVVSVAAIDSTDAVANFSSRGINDGDYIREEREIELAAPGVSVESTWKNGCYAVLSGTSMATPHVVGLAAKLWQGDAGTTRQLLENRARYNYTDIGKPGDDTDAGFGLPTAP